MNIWKDAFDGKRVAPHAQAPETLAAEAAAAVAGIAQAKCLNLPQPDAEELAAAKAGAASANVLPGVSLLVLEALQEQVSDPKVPTSKFFKEHILSVTAGTSMSYVEHLDAGNKGTPLLYVSHSKSMSWSDTVGVVASYATWRWPLIGHDKLYVWVDILCRKAVNTQGNEPTCEERMAESRAAIATCDGPTIVVLDGDGDVLDLAWTQWEIWCTAVLKGGAHIRTLCEEVLNLGHVVSTLKNLNPSRAIAANPADATAIKSMLGSESAVGSFPHIISQVSSRCSCAPKLCDVFDVQTSLHPSIHPS
mmetsp:Transcript_33117/g.98504  ORF Transcript_33117/g.98504 Transcript_33117/m.98504 type:complete len:306 (-) Transcript_33117:1207-2124(-)